jgi:hypothetical protein
MMEQREEVFDLDAQGDQNDRAQGRSQEVLLKLKVLVAGQENFEAGRGSTAQQLAIPQPRPALLLHRANLMTR